MKKLDLHHIMYRPKNLDKINEHSYHCIRSCLLHNDWLAFWAVALQITKLPTTQRHKNSRKQFANQQVLHITVHTAENDTGMQRNKDVFNRNTDSQ